MFPDTTPKPNRKPYSKKPPRSPSELQQTQDYWQFKNSHGEPIPYQKWKKVPLLVLLADTFTDHKTLHTIPPQTHRVLAGNGTGTGASALERNARAMPFCIFPIDPVLFGFSKVKFRTGRSRP